MGGSDFYEEERERNFKKEIKKRWQQKGEGGEGS